MKFDIYTLEFSKKYLISECDIKIVSCSKNKKVINFNQIYYLLIKLNISNICYNVFREIDY